MTKQIEETDDTRYFVYFLINPENHKPFYVGKGTGNRPNHHLKERSDRHCNAKKFWLIQKIVGTGQNPIIEIVQDALTENQAYDLEIKLIKMFGRMDIDPNGILTNILPGGNGGRLMNEDIRNKIRETRLSDDFKIRNHDSIQRSTRAITYRTKSEAEKDKIRQAQLGRQHSQATKDQMSRSKHLKTEEQKAITSQRITASKKGKPWSDARRMAQKGRVV